MSLNADLRNVDCMELMGEFPDDHFDLAIVDPPYGLNIASTGQIGQRGKEFTKKAWDAEIPPPEYFDELRRVSRNQIIWGGNYFPLPPSQCFLVWDKLQFAPSFAQAELAWTSFSRVTRVFKCPFNSEKYKIHPTQKPVSLYRWMLDNFSAPKEKILDTHLGSGSIAIACHYTGNHLTGSELDPEYFLNMLERIDIETRQMDLGLN